MVPFNGAILWHVCTRLYNSNYITTSPALHIVYKRRSYETIKMVV